MPYTHPTQLGGREGRGEGGRGGGRGGEGGEPYNIYLLCDGHSLYIGSAALTCVSGEADLTISGGLWLIISSRP